MAYAALKREGQPQLTAYLDALSAACARRLPHLDARAAPRLLDQRLQRLHGEADPRPLPDRLDPPDRLAAGRGLPRGLHSHDGPEGRDRIARRHRASDPAERFPRAAHPLRARVCRRGAARRSGRRPIAAPTSTGSSTIRRAAFLADPTKNRFDPRRARSTCRRSSLVPRRTSRRRPAPWPPTSRRYVLDPRAGAAGRAHRVPRLRLVAQRVLTKEVAMKNVVDGSQPGRSLPVRHGVLRVAVLEGARHRRRRSPTCAGLSRPGEHRLRARHRGQ